MNHLIVGMGEIGNAWYNVLTLSKENIVGVDLDKSKCKGITPDKIDVLHICVPFTNYKIFERIVLGYIQTFNPAEVIIHSSVKPRTTEKIQAKTETPLFYSPIRGVHSRMTNDMLYYTKYWTSDIGQTPDIYIKTLTDCGVPARKWADNTKSLELAKLLMDVTYYGWLILFAQHVKVEAHRYGVDDQLLWNFTDEIHRKLGNRPRMFSGDGIGGHCVMQDKDLSLIHI